MYTEKSAELKNDFYSRYGEAAGTLYFERVGLPCVLMDSGTHKLAFALGCGVRAYGRECGDVLRIINADSDECDVHFAPNGHGAQILYKQDMPGAVGSRDTEEYAIMKLLCNMRRLRPRELGTDAALCDRYGSGGWCAYTENGSARQVPLPLLHINVLLIRAGRSRRITDAKALARFRAAETERITAAAEGLRKCRIEVLFEMLNESGRSAEALFSLPPMQLAAVRAAREADGVLATRITNMGVICMTAEDKTDSAIRAIATGYERAAGCSAGISVVK